MSHIFPRHTKQLPPIAQRGEGCYLYDTTGKQYLDASGGAAVSCLGHGDTTIIEAVKAQLDKLAYAHTGFFTSEPAETLADLLISQAPGDLDRVYLVSGGSEAVEAALKLARQYYVEKGEPTRGRVIARKQSYHGNTMGALSAGGNAWRRAQFGPLLIDMSHIDPCYEYRLRRDDETLEDVILDLADGFAPDGTLGANSNFNVDELGSTELLFATQQTISGAIATQPTIAQKLEEIVPSLNLSQTNTTLQMRRNEIAAIPPTILGVPEAIALEDAPYSFTPIVTDEDDTSFSFSVTNLPSWASFNNSDGTISGVPVNANAGDTDQTSISVSDGFSTSTLGPFTITVKNTNDAPIIAGTPLTNIAENANYRFKPSASDEDVGSTLNYSIF